MLVETRGNTSIVVGTSSWREQFIAAVRVKPVPDADDDEEVTCCDYVMHFLSLFWKLLFACVPPTEILHGWLCFWVSILWIGLLTAIIGDVASAFGCTVGIADQVTAISVVALGTSLPDTFASKVSAIQDSTADNSVGNVTGSNAVNVFLGIGIACLAFSVTLFCTEAVIAIVIIVARRCKPIGGELGGPVCIKYMTSLLFVSLWLFYVTMSTLEVYHVIEGF
ncbi:hypothetical protein AAG570_012525 [Ranatra chinensis]|uniref:Sodium/calcium exchanger membrane region domain-containing protein n=1 Tax=Ranatra chinensis TaxID=642074 RepID=A0ABD0YE66_9HEMI